MAIGHRLEQRFDLRFGILPATARFRLRTSRCVGGKDGLLQRGDVVGHGIFIGTALFVVVDDVVAYFIVHAEYVGLLRLPLPSEEHENQDEEENEQETEDRGGDDVPVERSGQWHRLESTTLALPTGSTFALDRIFARLVEAVLRSWHVARVRRVGTPIVRDTGFVGWMVLVGIGALALPVSPCIHAECRRTALHAAAPVVEIVTALFDIRLERPLHIRRGRAVEKVEHLTVESNVHDAAIVEVSRDNLVHRLEKKNEGGSNSQSSRSHRTHRIDTRAHVQQRVGKMFPDGFAVADIGPVVFSIVQTKEQALSVAIEIGRMPTAIGD